MTRMTGPDCAVMCNLINTHKHTHTMSAPFPKANIVVVDRSNNTLFIFFYYQSLFGFFMSFVSTLGHESTHHALPEKESVTINGSLGVRQSLQCCCINQ